jgi:hypothetical protein
LKLFYDENTQFFYLLSCSQFWQKASGWINKTLLLIKQHITYMNISRYANIDKFVNIRYIFLLARRAYSWLFQLAQMWKLLAPGVGLGDYLTPGYVPIISHLRFWIRTKAEFGKMQCNLSFCINGFEGHPMNISKSGTISPCRKTKYAKCVWTDDVGDKLIKFTVVNLLTTSIECKDISMLTSTEKYLKKKTWCSCTIFSDNFTNFV